MSLGNNIRNLREGRELTQLELANELSISKSNISKYESGAIEPNIKTLNMIADFFNVTVDFLLDRKKDTIKEVSKTISEVEIQLLSSFALLNQDGRNYILQTIIMATKNPAFLSKVISK